MGDSCSFDYTKDDRRKAEVSIQEQLEKAHVEIEKLRGLEGVECLLATYVVNAFDQANTNKAIVNLGSRGCILRDAVNELRQELNKEVQRTILTYEEAL